MIFICPECKSKFDDTEPEDTWDCEEIREGGNCQQCKEEDAISHCWFNK